MEAVSLIVIFICKAGSLIVIVEDIVEDIRLNCQSFLLFK